MSSSVGVQAKFSDDMPCEMSSKIHLVDLAGRCVQNVRLSLSFSGQNPSAHRDTLLMSLTLYSAFKRNVHLLMLISIGSWIII